MSSVTAAHQLTRGLGDLLAPTGSGKTKIDLIYRDLSKRLPVITRRRVRSLFFGEAARVDYDEMRALEDARAEQEARRARRNLAETASLIAAHLASEGAALDGRQMCSLRKLAGEVASSGIGEKPQ